MGRTERREEMLSHVAAWKTSGKSRAIYCLEHGLNPHTMNYWCAKARHGKLAGGFVPLDVGTSDGLEVHYPNGVRLVLPAGTSMDQVAAYVRLY